jgi:hypothetical protein
MQKPEGAAVITSHSQSDSYAIYTDLLQGIPVAAPAWVTTRTDFITPTAGFCMSLSCVPITISISVCRLAANK